MWEKAGAYAAQKLGLGDILISLWPLWLIIGGIALIVVLTKKDDKN